MSKNFYIVDDDKSVRKILSNIISNQELGEVVGQAEDGTVARHEIISLQPGIVLIDLLLPGVDGITLVGELKGACPNTCFIMVSQVTNKEMISKAYTAGVDFFISKPINLIEVVSVLSQMQEKINMQNIIQSLRVAIGAVEPGRQQTGPEDQSVLENQKKQILSVLSRLGVLGETGSNDIVEICLLLLQNKASGKDASIKMNDLYEALSAKYKAEGGAAVHTASIEQRIRRAVNKAFNNIANWGIEDYGNEIFVTFGSAFFDFTEVRRQMNYIRGSSAVQGKANVKKFLEGIIIEIQSY